MWKPRIEFTTQRLEKNVESYCDKGKVVKPKEEIWITYAGSIGHSYAIDNVVRAAKILQDRGNTEYRFKILGSGPLKNEVERLSKELGCRNVEFLGYVAHPLMAAYLVKSDILHWLFSW